MGGFTYENNKNNPLIYNNSQELSLCSVFVKEFKIGLRPILKYLRDGSLHWRLMQLFLKIKSLDRNSAAGNLNVMEGLQTLKGKLLLREFVFTPKVGVRQAFGNPQGNEKDFSLIWEDFNPSYTRFPKGATHFELLYLVLACNSINKTFTAYSSIPIRRSKTDKMESLALGPKKVIVKEEGLVYISVIGLRFLEILGKEEYELLGRDALGIEVLEVR